MVIGVLAPCATHVKFMFCAAFTKESRNGFWGKIKLEQWEGGAEDNKTDEKQSRKIGMERERGKVNVPSRRENQRSEVYPRGHSKG